MSKVWRIATRKRTAVTSTWDIGLTNMTAASAKAAARQLNVVYPEYEHRAVKVEEK